MQSLAGGLPGGLGPIELLIILGIVVVLFGATRLTDIGKNLGKGIREFRREIKDGQDAGADEQTSATADDKKS